MPNLDDIKTRFSKRLDEQAARHAGALDELIRAERERMLREVKPAMPEAVAQRLAAPASALDRSILTNGDNGAYGAAGAAAARPMSPPKPQGQVQMTGSAPLRELDAAFIRQFNLGAYYPLEKLNYPTVYCETLEEFFQPFVKDVNMSPQARQSALDWLIEKAKQDALELHGGTFGVNFPGDGCYLNGWLFGCLNQVTPRQALTLPQVLQTILSTVAHEKLGHGLLGVYSTLGQAKTRLGLTLAEVARQFGLRPADDPLESLRQQQDGVLFYVSKLTEEGWASWIGRNLVPGGKPHTLRALLQAIQELPANLPDRQDIQAVTMSALQALFGENSADGHLVDMATLHKAVHWIATLDHGTDELFMALLSQPLRYVVGELLVAQAAANLGPLCAPYAALIAANVKVDFERMGLSDLQTMLTQDPRLNPDTRLAAISRLTLAKKNDPRELARQVEAALSLTVPQELRG
jgi:hypothetical protein